MTQQEFLKTLRRRLTGLPQAEIDEIIADYATHFEEGSVSGRSEEDIANALGDPSRIARELRAETGFRLWAARRTPGNFAFVIFAFVGLIAVDFIFLLPVLGGLILFMLIAGLVAVSLTVTGFAVVANLSPWSSGVFAPHGLLRVLSGLCMLGFGVGGGALLLLLMDWGVRLLSGFARLHYTVLDRVENAS